MGVRRAHERRDPVAVVEAVEGYNDSCSHAFRASADHAVPALSNIPTLIFTGEFDPQNAPVEWEAAPAIAEKRPAG